MIHIQPLKSLYAVLRTLGLRINQDKDYIGRINKGFDFLRFHYCPTGMTRSEAALSRRDQKIARLDEQGTPKERVGAFLRRRLGWIGTLVLVAAVVGYGCESLQRPLTAYGQQLSDVGEYAEIKVDCESSQWTWSKRRVFIEKISFSNEQGFRGRIIFPRGCRWGLARKSFVVPPGENTLNVVQYVYESLGEEYEGGKRVYRWRVSNLWETTLKVTVRHGTSYELSTNEQGILRFQAN